MRLRLMDLFDSISKQCGSWECVFRTGGVRDTQIKETRTGIHPNSPNDITNCTSYALYFPGTDRAPTSRNHKANAPKRQRFGIFKQTPAADQSFEEI